MKVNYKKQAKFLFRGNPPLWKLGASIILDLIGMASYVPPVVGEVNDVWWAPISSIIMLKMYGAVDFAAINFVEEILPGSDALPTASIAWFYLRISKRKGATPLLQAKKR